MKIEKTIDRESRLKLYVQIYAIIKEKIERGDWAADAQIPTEDDLCMMYDVSKATVREALNELVLEGYLRRQQGRGTFVTYPVPHPGLMMRTRLSYVLNQVEETGKKEILLRDIRKPSSKIKSALQTTEDVHYVCCKFIMNDTPVIEEMFIPLFELPVIEHDDIASKFFIDVIEEKGTKKVFRVEQVIEIDRVQDNSISRILNVPKSSPVLVMSRTYFSSDAIRIAYAQLTSVERQKVHIAFERIIS